MKLQSAKAKDAKGNFFNSFWCWFKTAANRLKNKKVKKSEKILLNNLETTGFPEEMPLKNIREGLGSVAYIIGNPKTKTEITLNIDLFFEDAVMGIIIAPAALPIAAQTSIPVILLGLTDYYGGYSKSALLNATIPAWTNINVVGGNISRGIWAFNFFNTGLPPLNALCQPGDMILIYTFVTPANVFTAMIRIRCQNVSYGTFLNSFVSDLITINIIRYIVPIANIIQFINPLIFGYQTLFGKVKSDTVDPRMYITSTDFQQQIADIPINLPIDKAVMLNFQMDVFCPTLSMILFVEKVEPLTHKHERKK
jgi:hypothetical protein